MATRPGCIITDYSLQYAPNGMVTPATGMTVRAESSVLDLFLQQQDGSWVELANSSVYAITDSAGMWSVTLPSQSNSDPNTVIWTITLPDRSKWAGPVTDAMVTTSLVTPLTLHDLKQSYGWGLVQVGTAPAIQVVQGPVGPQGVAGPAGTPPTGAANTVLAGPTSGGSGDTTMRSLVAADISGLFSSTFSVVGGLISAVKATLSVAGILRSPKYNVLDYGLVGDGVANETAALLDLINAVPANSVIFFPQGFYLIDPNQINITKTLTFEGAGQEATFLVPSDTSTAGTGGDLLRFNVGSTTKLFNCSLRNLALMPQTSDRTAGSMVHLGCTGGFHFNRVKIDSSLGHKPFHAVSVDFASDTTSHELHIAGTVDNGIHMLTTGSQTIVEWTMDDSCTFHSVGGYGFYAESNNSENQVSPGDIEGLHFDGTNFFGCNLGDIYLYGNGAAVKNVHAKGCVFDTSNGTHVTIISTTKRCENFEFIGNWVSLTTAGHGYAFIGNQTQDWRVLGGTVQLCNQHGIYASSAVRGTIRSVDIPDNSQGANATSYGIYLTGTGRVMVNGNKAYNSGKYTNLQNGFYCDTGCSDTDLLSNFLDTNYGVAGGTQPTTIIMPTARLRPWGNVLDSTQTTPFAVQGPLASTGTTTLVNKFTVDASGSIATDGFGIGGVATIGGFPSDSTHIQTAGANKPTVSGGKMVNFGADVRPQADLTGATYVVFQCAAPVSNNTGSSGGTSFNIGSHYSVYSQVKTSSLYTGTITNGHAFHAAAPSVGGGAITNSIGLYVEDMGTAANTFAIQTAGSTPSVFGGQITVGGLTTAGNITTTGTGVIDAGAVGILSTGRNKGLDANILTGRVSSNTDLWTPADHGLLAWTFDLAGLVSSSSTGAAPYLWLFKIKVPVSITVTDIVLGVNVAGATLANCYAGLYTNAGVLVGTTADQSTAWNTAGLKTMTLSGGPYTIAAGTYYVAIQVGSAATQPQFASSASSTNGGIFNAGLSGATLRAASTIGSNGPLPANITMTSNTALGRNIWAALS